MNTTAAPDIPRYFAGGHAVAGCLLGTAVGDALGLPAEGLSRRRQRAMFGALDGYRLLFGRGMYSDDTEHALLVTRALRSSGADPARFERSLAHGLKGWALLLPAGAGRATLSAAWRLLLGVPASRSGVPSAGNGPAMRAPLLGVVTGHDPARLRDFVCASTRLTHTDPRTEHGALAVAVAAHRFANGKTDADGFVSAMTAMLTEGDAGEMLGLLERMRESVAAGDTTERFADLLGCSEGVSGYILHTAPIALHAAFRHPADYHNAVLSAVACGGDTDTVAAITGGIVGAHVGPASIPEEWKAGLWEPARGVAHLDAVADSLARGTTLPPEPLAAVTLRNLLFLVVVLIHGLRRLLPPYE